MESDARWMSSVASSHERQYSNPSQLNILLSFDCSGAYDCHLIAIAFVAALTVI